MTHLGERVSALIDGELAHNERERALAHLTFCADCRAEVDGMRALKSRLRSLDPPAMPADLTMSLLRMGDMGPPARSLPSQSPRQLPGPYSIAPADTRPARRPFGATGPGRSPRRRAAGYVAVGVASAAVALGSLFLVNGEPRPAPAPEMMFPPQVTASPHGRLPSSPPPGPSPKLVP